MTIANLKNRAAQAAADYNNANPPATAGETAPPSPAQPTALAPADHAALDEALNHLRGFSGYWTPLLPETVDPAAFEMAAFAAVSNSRNLTGACRVNHGSLVYSLAMCAHFGLMPDGVQAALVPYKGMVKFLPMYQGYIDLMYRSGTVDSVRFDHIREGDEWSMDKGQRAPDDFSHKPDLLAEETCEPLIAYAFAWMINGHRSEVIWLNRKQAQAVAANHSQSFQNAERKRRDNAADFAKNPWKDEYNSPWHTNFDAMWLKSAVRRLAKRVPTAPVVRQLLAADAADSPHGQRVLVPAEVTRALASQGLNAVEAANPAASPGPGARHAYLYDQRTDPYCALPGCGNYEDAEIHLTA